MLVTPAAARRRMSRASCGRVAGQYSVAPRPTPMRSGSASAGNSCGARRKRRSRSSGARKPKCRMSGMVPWPGVSRVCAWERVWHDPGMTQMSMGSNIGIAASAVRATLRWTGGPGVPDVDCSALPLEESGEVGSDADFVFYNQPNHYSGAVRMVGRTPPPQAADAIDVDLARVPADYQRIVLAASAGGGTFGQVPDLQLLVTDLASGQPLAAFPMVAGQETAFVSAELYRRDGQWKIRAIGQGYSAGLAGLAGDFGIDVGGASGATAPAAPEAPAPPAAPEPPAAQAAPEPPAPGPPIAPAPPPGPPAAPP